MQIKHFLWALCCFRACDYRRKMHRLKLLLDPQHLHGLCRLTSLGITAVGTSTCRDGSTGQTGRVDRTLVQLWLYCRFPVSVLQISLENPQRCAVGKHRCNPSATALKVQRVTGAYSCVIQAHSADFLSLDHDTKQRAHSSFLLAFEPLDTVYCQDHL